jgi:hypothetical protein
MNVEYAFLCDYADSSNKLTAVGIGIDSIYVGVLPVIHPQLFVVLALKFTASETGRKRAFEVHLQDADAKDIIPPITGDLDIQTPAEGMSYRTHRVVNALYGLKLEQFGNYQISWLIDGNEAHSLHFRVIQGPRTPG